MPRACRWAWAAPQVSGFYAREPHTVVNGLPCWVMDPPPPGRGGKERTADKKAATKRGGGGGGGGDGGGDGGGQSGKALVLYCNSGGGWSITAADHVGPATAAAV